MKKKEKPLTTITDRVIKLELASERRETQYKFITDTLEEIKNKLDNGITTEVHDLKVWHEQHAQEEKESQNAWQRLLFPVVSQAIVSVIVIFITLTVLHVPLFK